MQLVLVSACFSKEEIAAQAAHWGGVPVFLNLHFFGSSSLMMEICVAPLPYSDPRLEQRYCGFGNVSRMFSAHSDSPLARSFPRWPVFSLNAGEKICQSYSWFSRSGSMKTKHAEASGTVLPTELRRALLKNSTNAQGFGAMSRSSYKWRCSQ